MGHSFCKRGKKLINFEIVLDYIPLFWYELLLFNITFKWIALLLHFFPFLLRLNLAIKGTVFWTRIEAHVEDDKIMLWALESPPTFGLLFMEKISISLILGQCSLWFLCCSILFCSQLPSDCHNMAISRTWPNILMSEEIPGCILYYAK